MKKTTSSTIQSSAIEDDFLVMGVQDWYGRFLSLIPGERVGALTFLCSSEQEVRAVESQLKIIIRPLYSNPPINGARIATEIMTQPEIYTEW